MLATSIILSGCGRRKTAILSPGDRADAREAIEAWRAWALDPAGLGPLGVDSGPLDASAEGLSGTARLVRPEREEWNRWGEAGHPLLFNDRAALLVEVALQGESGARWRPERTTLEVNRPDHRLRAAGSPDDVLAELLSFALLQERWALDGDLVQRTRNAGGFRDRYLSAEAAAGGVIHGLIAFPRGDSPMDVAALRLTVVVEHGGVPQRLEWVFQ